MINSLETLIFKMLLIMNLDNIYILEVETFIYLTDSLMELGCAMLRVVVKLNVYCVTHQNSLHALTVLGQKQGCHCKSRKEDEAQRETNI